MKQIRKFYNKILLFIKRRQMLFVSFAMIIIYIIMIYILKNNFKSINIVLSAIPAALIKAAGKTMSIAKSGADNLINNTEERMSPGQNNNTVSSGSQGRDDPSNSIGNSARNAFNSALPGIKKGLNIFEKKNKGPLPNNLVKKPEEKSSELANEKKDTKEEVKIDNNTKKESNTESNSEEETPVKDIVFKVKKVSTIIKFAPFLIPFFIIIIVLILLMSNNIGYQSKIINGFVCNEDSSSPLCQNNSDNSSWYEKSKNLIKYGYFSSDENVLIAKVEEIYDKYYNEYKIKIDIPTLLSTMLADGINFTDEIDSNGNRILNSKLAERFNKIEEVAKIQIKMYAAQYECILVSGVPSMRLISKVEISPNEKKDELVCGTTNVGDIVYRYDYQINLEEYYENLYDYKNVLGYIYGEDKVDTDSNFERLISMIKLQRDTFKAFYGNKEDDVCASPGNIPSELISDEKVKLQTPIKGTYNISSYFGIREGEYSNHKGIDVYGDTTIYAAGTGVVTRANTEKLGGNVIEITHTTSDGRKFISQYGHLKTMLVSVGDTVIGGETIIGIMGATGEAANGVHLHFQFWEKLSDGKTELYNPLTLFVGADNYSYQCVGSKVTSDTCTSTGGSIAFISDKNGYDYNLIRAIFKAKGIEETSEVKNEINFGDEFNAYVSTMSTGGTVEQRTILSNINISKKEIRVDGNWYSYDGNKVENYVLKTNFINKYGTVDEKIYNYVNMGVGKILGNKYSCLGYTSSKEMYTEWNSSHHAQVEDTIRYLADCLNLKEYLLIDDNLTDDELENRAQKIASAYFDNDNLFSTNSYAKNIASIYKNLKEKGESLQTLLFDCTTINAAEDVNKTQAGRCEMYKNYLECMGNVNQYDNSEYWGDFVKQAGTSLARVRLLTVAHDFWGYVRYCGGGNTISTGQVCNNDTYNSKEELIPEYSELVGSQYGDVVEGLDCGGFITKVFVTYIRRYSYGSDSSVAANYNLPYVLNSGGMCSTNTDYTTVTYFPDEDIVSYYENTKNKIKPGDVICDISKEFDGDGDYIRGTRHTQMYVGYDDEDLDGLLDADEPMYFIHTGSTSLGVVIKKITLNTINDKYHTYGTVFSINDKVK